MLTVGVGAYQFGPLPGSIQAARAVESFFLEQQKLTRRRTFRDVRVWPGLYDQGATRQTIRDALRRIAAAASEEDVVFLFFSGHGIVPAGQELFHFAPYGIQGLDPTALRTSGVDAAMLATGIREMRAGRVVLVVDACQSGAAVESLAKIGEVKLRSERQRARAMSSTQGAEPRPVGVVVLAAAWPLQLATQPGEGMSWLAEALLTGLRTRPAEGRGIVSMHDVVRHVQRTLPALSAKGGSKHEPMADAVGVDFAIAVASPSAGPRR